MDPIMGLSLTDNLTLEYVLSDIPLFCVGLTAFAVIAFFIVMRRITLPAIYLYTSSLLAFIAAILDLSQILLRGVTATDDGLALNTVTGLINTREVGLGLSFFFRFLYLWEFVAQRPRYEPRQRTDIDPFSDEKSYHSASWERWGALGFVLKYALLGSVISIPILQIVWRIATGYSAVYVADSTIQIAVSALFIAKLMLNLFLSTVGPWWRPFLPYLVPIIALMVSTGIGAGNLLFFKFSETTLGRFLQAVEMYALILNVLIFTFYNVPRYVEPTTAISDRRKRSSFFTGMNLMNEKMDDGPPFLVTVSPEPQIARAVTTPSSRESVVSRISSWMPIRKPRPKSGEQRLWNSGDAELGISTEDSQILVPPTPNTFEVTTPSTVNRGTGVSFSSYYGLATSSRLTMPGVVAGNDARNTDSPVYGLDGIVISTAPAPAEPESPILSRRPVSSVAPSLTSTPERESVNSLNSFDELLRQQTELDRSIAALRLFSPTTTVTNLPPPPEPQVKITPDYDRTLSVSSGKSASNRSEFSLSIFPDPPLAAGVLPAESAPQGRGREAPFPSRARLPPSRIPQSAISTNADDDFSTSVKMRFGSQGTQYDVTSFIGDLMTPGPSSEPTRVGVLGEVTEKPEMEVSDVESPVISSMTPTVTLRPLLLGSTSPPITSLPSGGAPASTTQAANYEYPVLKPLLLGSAAPTGPSPRRVPGAGGVGGPRRPSRAGRDGRPMISVPRPQDEAQVDEAEAFEKPRRPPAVSDN
ncbi:hypothetical protein DFH08DRAFT_375645 [Mycena albidolilacea]|uniref:Uncharacterized protein n=1 Tax=Mycena albidolilacea TaxID=1033008 RepID=A0AAD7AKI9_9AGAR|nr:hypothetical protein DFH08DRAFT_375645 [Mycena albidolilacea]